MTLPGAETMKAGIMGLDCLRSTFLRDAPLAAPLTWRPSTPFRMPLTPLVMFVSAGPLWFLGARCDCLVQRLVACYVRVRCDLLRQDVMILRKLLKQPTPFGAALSSCRGVADDMAEE